MGWVIFGNATQLHHAPIPMGLKSHQGKTLNITNFLCIVESVLPFDEALGQNVLPSLHVDAYSSRIY